MNCINVAFCGITLLQTMKISYQLRNVIIIFLKSRTELFVHFGFKRIKCVYKKNWKSID